MTAPYRSIRVVSCSDRVLNRGPQSIYSARGDSSLWSIPKTSGVLLLIASVVQPDAFAQSANPTSGSEVGLATGVASSAYLPLLLAQSIWLVLVGVGAPLLSRWSAGTRKGELRGLNLPRGSIRAMLALLVVGTFMNFLVFGGSAFDGETFDKILAALVGLTGSVIGFYFGGRSAAPAPSELSGGSSQ